MHGAYGKKLPTVLTGLAVARLPAPPTSAGPTSPSAFSPWHFAQRCAKTARPSIAVPEPSGNPFPSGATVTPNARISSPAGARPTPYFGDCAASTVAKRHPIATTRGSGIRIRDAPIGRDRPPLDA